MAGILNSKLIARYVRYLFLAGAVAVLANAVFSIWITIRLKYVFLRPVHDVVETGEGDPYMTARDCMDVFVNELNGPIQQLAICAIILFMLAVLPRPTG